MNIIKLTEKKKNCDVLINLENITHITSDGDGARIYLQNYWFHFINVKESLSDIAIKLEK